MDEAVGPGISRRLHAGLDAHDGEASLGAFLVPGARVAEVMTSTSAGAPLAEALRPLCGFSWSELRRKLPSCPRLLTAPAARDLQDALHEDLARLFGPVLSVELGIARESGDDMAPTTLVHAAIGSRDGLFQLFDVYPVLARLCATLIGRWVGSVCDLLTRLVADRDAIRPLIRESAEQLRIAAVLWDERPAVLERHVEELVRGFRDAFAWSMRHRERLLREDAPLAELLRKPVDVAAYDLPTARLSSVRSMSPSLLQDETAHRAAAEMHSLRFLGGISNELADVRPLVAAEARATASLTLLSLTAHPSGMPVRVEEEDGSAWDMPGLLAAASADDVRARIGASTRPNASSRYSYSGSCSTSHAGGPPEALQTVQRHRHPAG